MFDVGAAEAVDQTNAPAPDIYEGTTSNAAAVEESVLILDTDSDDSELDV